CRHNPLPQPRRRPRTGSRTSADLQAATVFRPPSIGRPILFLSAGLIRYETVTLPGLRTSVDEAMAGLAARYPPLPTLTAKDPGRVTRTTPSRPAQPVLGAHRTCAS